MNVEEYVAARYGRLLERAVELGAEEGLASEYVDQVLLDQRKAISRAEDPDPLVYEALERAVLKQPRQPRSPWPFVAVGLAAVAVAVGVVLANNPRTHPMPSVFGYTGEQARALLEDDGYDVLLRPVRGCEPPDQAVASDPPAGEPVQHGDVVAVFTAIPAGTTCRPLTADRGDAWHFIGFAVSGQPEPTFARTVTVVIDGIEGEPRSGVGASTSERWRAVRKLVADQAQAVARTDSGAPALLASEILPPATTCGIPRPAGAVDRTALRIQVDGRPPDSTSGCPLTVDLYRSSQGLVDGVVIYSAVEPS